MLRLIIFLAISDVVVFGAPDKKQNVPKLDGKIIGGEEVNIEDFPYQVSVLFFGYHTCGGSIISPRYVLTAAHCTEGASAAHLSIRAGSSIHNEGGVRVYVAEILQHPQYNGNTIDYDISVLRLEKDLSFSASIRPIHLARQNEEVIPGSDCVVSGWGTVTVGESIPSHLQAVTVHIISKDVCIDDYGQGMITPQMICAGIIEGGKDACQGDSGGPLVQDGQLIGIVSWGYGCAKPMYPGVYASVPALRTFINTASGI